MEDNNIIDVSKILIVPSDTEIPVHDNSVQTKRPLCADFPENAIILDKTEAIRVITDISEDLENNTPQECAARIPQYIEDLQAVFDPLNVTECTSDLFKDKDIKVIDNIDELKKYLSELLIRFDTSPRNYTKDDYLYLLAVLYKSLIHLYQVTISSVISNDWHNPLRENWVPSEKLTKTTIDQEVQARQSADQTINERITQEINARQQADQNLYDDLFPLIAAAL